MKKTPSFSWVACLIVTVFLFSFSCSKTDSPTSTAKKEAVRFPLAAKVKQLLDHKLRLIASLLEDPIIIQAIKKSNVSHQNISQAEIQKLDERWRRSSGVDDFIRPFLINKCADKLATFQETHPGFPEIFIADSFGLNVCQTNKTSDYYQADEEWWIQSFNGGDGRAFHGDIEYDESAHSRAIALYVPVINPKNKRAIGVCKAIVDLTVLKAEL